MIENPNAERAMELADSLERRAKFARRIASNISRLGLPKDYRGVILVMMLIVDYSKIIGA